MEIAASKSPSITDLLKQDLRRAGVPLAHVEDDVSWQMRQKPVEFRSVPKPMGLGMMSVGFYPHLFRWRMDDGRSFATVVNPVLRERGPWFEEDGIAMGRKLWDAIMASSPSPMENG